MLRLVPLLFAAASSIPIDSLLGITQQRQTRTLEQDESVYAWMFDYALKVTTCHTITEYGVDYYGEGYSYKQRLIEFQLCSAGTCESICEGDDYLVPLEDYANAYAEQMKINRENACKDVQQNCVCEEDEEENEEGEDEDEDEMDCEDKCYLNAGLDYCIEEESEDVEEELDLENFVHCQLFDADDDSNDLFYIGLKCTEDGEGVNVAIFMDSYCSVEKGNDVYLPSAEYLPYQNETIIPFHCMNCTQLANEDEEEKSEEEYGGVDLYEVSGFCLVNYAESLKCEENADIYYPNSDGCELLNHLYLREDGYEPKSTKGMEFSIHLLLFTTLFFFAIIFRLCYIAQKQQRKLREDELMWRNRQHTRTY